MSRQRARYLLPLDPDSIHSELLTLNTDAIALHYPGRDGLCPICAESMCAIRLRAVKVVRAAGIKVPVLPPHEPRRPQWDCELCNCPWPCSQARVTLGDQYEADRDGLADHMRALMTQARRELRHAPGNELHSRFLSWVPIR